MFLPIVGLVDAEDLQPGDLVGVNKDSYLVIEKLPVEYDSRVKAMELDEKPKEDYSDVGGLDKQIQELIEAVVLPMTHAERFKAIGVKPPKGVLLYGPPGTGKTLLARACAKQTDAVFLKLAGPQLVQMYIGDGSKVRGGWGGVGLGWWVVGGEARVAGGSPPPLAFQIVRDAFALAKEKVEKGGRNGAIIFIDEVGMPMGWGVPGWVRWRSGRSLSPSSPHSSVAPPSSPPSSWMPSVQSAAAATRLAIARCSGRCLSC